MKFLSALLFFIVIIGGIQAQTAWDLQKCIRYAIDNNLEIKQSVVNEKIALENLNQSRRNRLPEVGLSSGAGVSYGRSIDPNTNDIISTNFFDNSYYINSSVVLFDGFRLKKQTDYNRFLLSVEKSRGDHAVDMLAFNVMSAFYDLLYYKGLERIAQAQVSASELSLKAMKRKAEEGLKSLSDVAEVQSNFEMEELHLIQAENKVNEALLNLRKLMNLEKVPSPGDFPDSIIAPESFAEVLTEADAGRIFSSFITWSPVYLTAESMLKAAGRSLAISKSNFFPGISGNWSAGTGFYETNTDNQGNVLGFGQQIKENRSQYVGISLQFPLFTRLANRSAVSVTRLNVEEAHNQLESTRQNLFFEVSKAVNDLKAQQKEYAQYQRQQDADSLALAVAEKKLSQGLISVIEFYVVKNRYAGSQANVLRSRLQLDMQHKMIGFYKGNRFWE